jgi:hypothetical protein
MRLKFIILSENKRWGTIHPASKETVRQFNFRAKTGKKQNR